MFGIKQFWGKVKADYETVSNYKASEKYADDLFSIVKHFANQAAVTVEEMGPKYSDVAPEFFKLELEQRWPKVLEAFSERLTAEGARELTAFALTMPSSGLTEKLLAEMKEQYGEDQAFRYGAEFWSKTLFDLYRDRMVKDFPR